MKIMKGARRCGSYNFSINSLINLKVKYVLSLGCEMCEDIILRFQDIFPLCILNTLLHLFDLSAPNRQITHCPNTT